MSFNKLHDIENRFNKIYSRFSTKDTDYFKRLGNKDEKLQNSIHKKSFLIANMFPEPLRPPNIGRPLKPLTQLRADWICIEHTGL